MPDAPARASAYGGGRRGGVTSGPAAEAAPVPSVPGVDVGRTPPRWRTWATAVGIAEGLGILAAAALAVVTAGVTAGGPSGPVLAGTLAAAAAGGAVEGYLVGAVQSTLLRRWLPGLSARRWVASTIGVVVALWLLGSLPSALLAPATATGAAGGTAADGGPAALAMVLVGLVGGAVGGAAIGAVQAAALRGLVARPRRWITANAVAWSVGLLVILAAAGLPDADSPRAVVALVALTAGLLAGLVVGAITGWALRGLDVDAPPARTLGDRLVLEALRSPAHALLSGRLLELRYRGRRTGAWHVLPTGYAPAGGERLVVLVGHAARKTWWRSIGRAAEVVVVVRGDTRPASARVVRVGDPEHAVALAAYRDRFPGVRASVIDPLVVVEPLARPPATARVVTARREPQPVA